MESSEADPKRLPAVATQNADARGKNGRKIIPESWKMHELYFVWRTMQARCSNPNNCSFYRYGARGIKVCERWKNFDLFVSDMGPRPSKAHTIERKNSDGHYEPTNCRWATRKEQSLNTCRNRYIESSEQKLTICQWADKLGFSHRTIAGRLNRGWSIERALNAQLTKPGRKFTPEQIQQIKTDPRGCHVLARLFSVSSRTIWKIKVGRSYKSFLATT